MLILRVAGANRLLHKLQRSRPCARVDAIGMIKEKNNVHPIDPLREAWAQVDRAQHCHHRGAKSECRAVAQIPWESQLSTALSTPVKKGFNGKHQERKCDQKLPILLLHRGQIG